MTYLQKLLLGLLTATVSWSQIPEQDQRNFEIRHTDTHNSMPEYTPEEWEKRASFLRDQILFSAGLDPLPEKTPLNAQVGEAIVHEGYSVASVLLETYPGFYLGGNVYRPVGKTGPFPAVVSPHGHWRYGRFENTELGSVPARAINMARQGAIVFTYDMVGWNDTMQVPHGFAGKREELWLIGTLGLQLWNSIRVVDYLESLPDVDGKRIAATGASGGATQTFLLTAVDSRINYSAPVNMVSFIMQGGSRCENTPLLRIGTNNVEFASLFAPKPMLMVAATGDWTVNTPNEEFPAVQDIYRLLDAESNVEMQQFDSPHNYHLQSREAVYRFFGKHLFASDDTSQYEEQGYQLDQLSNLLALWGRSLPENAVNLDELVQQRITVAEEDTHALKPHDATSLQRARTVFQKRLNLAIHAEAPAAGEVLVQKMQEGNLLLGRKATGDRIPARFLNADSRQRAATLLVHEDGVAAAEQSELGMTLAKQGSPLLMIDVFQTGSAVVERNIEAAGTDTARYYHVFNRSDDANRVQDILTALTFLREQQDQPKIRLVGMGRAGLWTLLAAALDEGDIVVVADLDQFDAMNDEAYESGLFIPGLRRAGDLRATAALLSRGRLLLHNANKTLPEDWYRAAFEAAASSENVAIENSPASTETVLEWLQAQ